MLGSLQTPEGLEVTRNFTKWNLDKKIVRKFLWSYENFALAVETWGEEDTGNLKLIIFLFF